MDPNSNPIDNFPRIEPEDLRERGNALKLKTCPFCGWADSQNSQPFYRAWREWCCRYMAYRYEDGRLVEIVDGLENVKY